MTDPHPEPPPPSRFRGPLAFLLMLLAVVAVYWPAPSPPGHAPFAADYFTLHQRRMTFAREALLGPTHTLPAWYPHELLGTPFRANVQNFPFVPTRLIVLLALDPMAARTFPIAAILSACVAAAFTFGFCRAIGLGATSAAAAGWTFAAGGFYASRVAAGHLPLLEAYPALPMLLWAVERLVRTPSARTFVALGLAAACAGLVGHPQLSVYALVTAAAYAAWRATPRALVAPAAAMAIGVGCAAFALVPMLSLVGRSTRVLALDAPTNDVPLPYGRLVAWLFPSIDGYPSPFAADRAELFTGYPTSVFFWDTVNYIGWLPFVAIAGLFLSGRRGATTWRRSPATFVIVMGVASILFALPWWQSITQQLPGTFLRSPARLTYLTGLALAVGLGFAIDRLLRVGPRRAGAIVAVALVAHAIDLGHHDRRFLATFPLPDPIDDRAFAALRDRAGDGRVAIDAAIVSVANRRLDDVGFFDSVMLAGPYRWLMALDGAPPTRNVQNLDGGELSVAALRAAGVRVVVTTRARPDLARLGAIGPINVYAVDDAAPRASFSDGSPVSYRRDGPDTIRCTVDAASPGRLRVLESFDPGWRATVDGIPTPVDVADGALIAVDTLPGRREVVLTYRTPGATAGAIVSLASLAALGVGAWLVGRRGQVESRPAPADR